MLPDEEYMKWMQKKAEENKKVHNKGQKKYYIKSAGTWIDLTICAQQWHGKIAKQQ